MADTFDYDVFISYSSADKDWVRGELLTRLESKGLRVCIDFRDFQLGAPSVKEMERALVTSAKTVLVLTPNYLKSAWTEFEALMLQTLDPANRQLRLLPLVKEKCDLPLHIKYLTYVDFTDPGNLDFAWSRLLNAIKPGLDDAVETLHATSLQSTPIPRPPQYGFVARYDDEGNGLVARVSELLNQNRAVALVGSGGLGKTTLAAEIVRRLTSPSIPPLAGEGRKGGVVWASADGRADFSLGTLLDETATQLGNPDVRTLALEKKIDAVRTLLGRSIERPYTPVIVIDNFETIAAEQQKVIADFVNTLSCAVLITSRVAVDGAERVNIGAMTETESRKFLNRWIASSKKKNALTPLIDEIANLAERNPMVMRWIIGQLERAQRMSDVLDELSRGQGDAATRVFGRSFGLLNADAQATLLSLVLFVPSANRIALAFTAGFSDNIKRLNDALKPLADLQLLETDANNERLSVVGLTRRFTNAQLNKDANAAAYRKRFVDYFVKYAEAHSKTTPEDLNALEDERENLLAAMDTAFAAEDWQSVMRIMDAIGNPMDGFLSLHGYWDEAIAHGEQAMEAARGAGDESTVARFTGNAASIHYLRGEYEKARETYEQVLEISKRLNEEQYISALLHQLGMIAQDQGDYETARQRYDESLKIKRKLGNPSGIALTLGQLGNLEYQQSNMSKHEKTMTRS